MENTTSLVIESLSQSSSLTDPYVIPELGEYCVLITVVEGGPVLTLYLEFPYGKLPATEYPFLPVRPSCGIVT